MARRLGPIILLPSLFFVFKILLSFLKWRITVYASKEHVVLIYKMYRSISDSNPQLYIELIIH